MGFLAGSLLMSSFALAQAQEIRPLQLQQAIELSLQNSKQLQASSARVEAATAQLREALDSRLPDLKVSGSWLFLAHPNIDLKTGSSGSGSGSSEPMPQPSQAMYGMATLSLPLYAGGKIRYGIESARLVQQATEKEAAGDQEAVTLRAITAFCNLYKSESAMGLVQENLRQSQQRDHDFENLEKNGLLARNDLLKAQLQTANIEMALVNAENNLKLAMVSLNLLMGLPEQTQLQPDTTGLHAIHSLAGIEAYEQDAFNNRKDLQAAGLQQKASHVAIKSAHADYYPSLGLSGGYIAVHVPDLVTATNLVNAGVGLQYNLGSLWKTKAKIDAAKANEKEVVARREMLTDDVRLSINKAYQNYLSAQKKIYVQEKSVVNATENYRITKNKHDNNLVTTTELLDANVALLESRISLEEARADIVIAYNTLLKEAGILQQQTEKSK